MDNKIMQMKQLLVISAVWICSSLSAQQKDYPFTPVPFTQVQLTDHFWLPRIKINHNVTIPASFERCEKTGRVKNFDMAAAKSGKFCTIYPFDDTDIYKTIEGASFSLSIFPDLTMVAYIDSLIQIIAKAQEPDGYLYTARTIDPLHPHKWAGKNRWEKERELSHELYNSGHLYEAAVAHFAATGKKSLLNIAIKNADLVCSVFGNDKLRVAPGHEVVEMGLVKLYRVTGKKEYLDAASFFLYERGHFIGYDATNPDPFKNGSYWQDHIPVVDQKEAIGHAVRAGYLYAAMADVAALNGDKALLKAIDSIWVNLVSKKMYIQGGAGAIGNGERYGKNDELPNATAYNETCAAIANVYWNQRMFQLHGDAKYIDILEKILYNGLLSGVGLDGKSFFYTNAMQVTDNFKHNDLEPARSGWFDCSCCPTNLTRLLPSIPGYMYATTNQQLFINLFINSNTSVTINHSTVNIEQQNNYPWEGNLIFKVHPTTTPLPFTINIRIPGWATGVAMPSDLYHFTNQVSSKINISINGKITPYTIVNGYAVLTRRWKSGDSITMQLPMEVQTIQANPHLKDDIGKIALQKGPLMYCAESADNAGSISSIVIPQQIVFSSKFDSKVLQGVNTIKGNVLRQTDTLNPTKTIQVPFTAIPYYAWANRGKGEMMLWFPQQKKVVTPTKR
jgi:hypothetical protein